MMPTSSRRSFLQVGVVAGLGLGLDQFFRLTAQANPALGGKKKEAAAQSVIHIFLPGGIAHQDFMDPKPLAPIEYRGEIGTTKTNLAGVFFSEHMKKTGDIADLITVC